MKDCLDCGEPFLPDDPDQWICLGCYRERQAERVEVSREP